MHKRQTERRPPRPAAEGGNRSGARHGTGRQKAAAVPYAGSCAPDVERPRAGPPCKILAHHRRARTATPPSNYPAEARDERVANEQYSSSVQLGEARTTGVLGGLVDSLIIRKQ